MQEMSSGHASVLHHHQRATHHDSNMDFTNFHRHSNKLIGTEQLATLKFVLIKGY